MAVKEDAIALNFVPSSATALHLALISPEPILLEN